jgi:hypothetical protein
MNGTLTYTEHLVYRGQQVKNDFCWLGAVIDRYVLFERRLWAFFKKMYERKPIRHQAMPLKKTIQFHMMRLRWKLPIFDSKPAFMRWLLVAALVDAAWSVLRMKLPVTPAARKGRSG